MLVICKSIREKELVPLSGYFDFESIKDRARRVKGGMGNKLQGWSVEGTEIFKSDITGKNVHGRVVFLFLKAKQIYFLAVVRLKKDKVIGENITMTNKTFAKLMYKNYDLIIEDFKNLEFKQYPI